MLNLKEPTAEQCTAREKVFEDNDQIGYAIWYPQMGGYVGKAVALIDKNEDDNFIDNSCFEVFVWHDGEFPFDTESGKEPVQLHHCSPEQFIDFGQTILNLQKRG